MARSRFSLEQIISAVYIAWEPLEEWVRRVVDQEAWNELLSGEVLDTLEEVKVLVGAGQGGQVIKIMGY